jgi:hypothetical protein
MPAASLPSLRPPPAVLNKATWLLSEALTWRAFRPTLNRQRARVGLPGLSRRLPSRWPRGRRPPVLYGFSPSVVPVPPDWPDDVHVTGYWFRDPDPAWSPPPALTAFLAAGPAPVYLGFGSMPDADPAGLVGALVGGARRAEHRMVLHSGWSKLREAGRAGLVGDDVLVVDDVPHAWLFPRMAAVVHHGGAGTTAAALRRACPPWSSRSSPTSSSGVAGSPRWPRAPRRSRGNGSPTRGSPRPSPTPSAVATGLGAWLRRWRRRTASARPSTCSKPSHDGTARAAATAGVA